MSKSGQEFVAKTEGTQSTLYAVCRAMGIPLTKEQEEFQAYLESRYPPVVQPSYTLKKVSNDHQTKG